MNKNSLKILAYSMFFVSLVLTVTLLSKNATGWNILLMLMLGLCLELSKCYMLHLAIINKNKFYLIISIMLFMFSFVASISAFTNNSLKVSEQAKIESLEYKATLDRVKDLEVLKSSYSDNYKTKKDEIGNEILVLKKSLNKIEVKSGKGTSEVFNLLGGIFGVDPSILFIIFNVLIALVFELTTVVLFLESLDGKVVVHELKTAQEKVVLQEEIQNNKLVDFKGVTQEKTQEKVQEKTEEKTPYDLAVASIEKQKEKVMGFDLSDEKKTIKKTPKKTEKKDIVVEKKKERFSTQDLEKYVNFMYSDAKEKGHDIAPGFRTIAKNIKLTPYRCDKIRGHLETIGVIKPEGQVTKILKWEE